MAVNSNNTGQKQGLSTPIILVVVVLAVAFIGYLAYHNFVPHEHPAVASGPLTPQEQFLKQEAQKCGGDFSKLPPEDQAKVQAATRGYGVPAMKTAFTDPRYKNN